MYGVLLLLVNVESECKWTLIEKLKYTKHFLIDYNKIAYESHELSVSELDTELLPANYKEVLTDSSVRVYYYAYEELIVYVITNIKNRYTTSNLVVDWKQTSSIYYWIGGIRFVFGTIIFRCNHCNYFYLFKRGTAK